MGNQLFGLAYGVIPACDVAELSKFEKIIKNTAKIEGIVGYKIGFELALNYGLKKLVSTAREYTDHPLIYDHQKAGTDIPQMGIKFATVCGEAGIRGVIIFPQAGPKTEEAFIDALFDKNLIPIVGGEMTHPQYLAVDGGYIRDNAPEEMYTHAAKKGVEHFVIPGNKPKVINRYHKLLFSLVSEPKYLMPGIGRQGGDIKSAFEALKGAAAYAIIGSAIYEQKDMVAAAKRFCDEALKRC
jgi:orotidine-5'-phosphate decarboxylase